MIEIIGGLVAALLAGLAYVFKVQRDGARRDAEENKKVASQAMAVANEKEKRAKVLIEAIKDKQRIDEKTDEIVKRPERDFFE